MTRLALALLLAALAAGPLAAQALEPAFPGLSFTEPVELADAGDGRLLVAEKAGRVVAVTPGAPATSAVALDIRSLVRNVDEQGLIGIALHPDVARNGFLYVHYSGASDGRTVLARYTRSAADPAVFDPASAVVLLEVPQPYANHNGGKVAFGPDGFLYLALGDGGNMGDPGNRAQDRALLLGKILRLDVDHPAPPLAYGIPPGNPFAGNTTGDREEIYALGFRNPFKFSFDRATGALWVGDVGQAEWEEVDLVENGGNYGWRIREGAHCYTPSTGCATDGLTDPVFEYDHSGGACSITGGSVYRGTAIPGLAGDYVFADYCVGDVWALPASGAPVRRTLAAAGGGVIGIGEDAAGELFVLKQSGQILRLVSTPTAGEGGAPAEVPLLRLVGANPFTGQTAVEVSTSGIARVTLTDVLGRRVAVLFDGTAAPGLRVPIDGTALAPGVYVVRLETSGRGAPGQTATLRLLRTR